MTTQRFNIGDEFWVARAGTTDLQRPCRVCAGSRLVTLILGSGEAVSLECGYCGHGFEGPRGFETYYGYRAEPALYFVSGVVVNSSEKGEQVEYRAEANGGYYTFPATDCFLTYDMALARSTELVAKHETDQERQMSVKEKGDHKSYAWHAGYHLREAKRERASAERHERKAVIMKSMDRTLKVSA